MNKLGIITTIVYTGIVLYFRWDSLCTLKTMPLNEFGDFFAGVFGPVAIFWLILGFLQQGKELQQSTEALQLQADELNNSVKQQKELVKVTNGQIENTKEEEKINRTISEIQSWLVIRREVEESNFDRNQINSICNKLEWIISIEEHKFKRFYDYTLLINILKEKSTLDLLSHINQNLDDEIQASLDDPELQGELEHIDQAEQRGFQATYSIGARRILHTEQLSKRIVSIVKFINEYKS